MNILFLNWLDIKNPNAGGAELYSWEICKRFVKEGNSVEFVTSISKGLPIIETVDEIEITRIGNDFTLYPRAFFWVSKNSERYDLIIEVINGPPFLLPIKIPYQKHLVIIFHLPTFITTSKKLLLLGPFEFIISRYLLRLFYRHRKVITDGQNTKNELINLGFTNIYIAEDGLDTDKNAMNSPLHKEKIIVILGPLKPWKRIDHGIMAFSVLPPSWRLFILGKGDKAYTKKIKRMVINMGIEQRVTFTGYVDKTEKISILSRSTLSIITSEKEGFSLPAIESQRYGCIPVMYKFPGMENSVLPGLTSVVVPNGDIKSLQEALIKISSDQKTINLMSIQAKEFSKQFTWDNTFEKVKNTIKDQT